MKVGTALVIIAGVAYLIYLKEKQRKELEAIYVSMFMEKHKSH